MTEPEPSSRESRWVERVRAGDGTALEEMFRAYYGSLCAFAGGFVRSPDVVEELVQNVFFNVWVQRERWMVRDSVKAYLYGATRNQAMNHLKRRHVELRWQERATQESGAAELDQTTQTAEDRLQSEELTIVLQQAIDRLPARARLVVTLRWQHQLRYAEIAAVLGISVKGVENQLARAIRALREHLSDMTR